LVLFLPVWLIYSDHSGNNLILFIPGLAFFISQGIIFFKKSWKRELIFLIFFIYILTFSYSSFYNIFDLQNKVGLNEIMIQEVKCSVPIEGKKILVIGNDINYYAESQQATPYFSWRIARMQLERLDYYDNLVDIYQNFDRDLPEVIIDLQGVMKRVFGKIPLLEQKYLLAEEEGVYVLNKED
jgi:hypothetical protein